MVSQHGDQPQARCFFFCDSGAILPVFVALLFLASIGVRACYITGPQFTKHPGRQYHSAKLARWYYVLANDDVQQWKRETAKAAAPAILEPPIMERITACLGRIAGGPLLWIPRLLSALWWVLGGVPVYALGKRLVSVDGAVVATALYLFLPFGISASASFQPEALMVMATLFAIWAIVWYHDRPSWPRLAVTTGLGGLAIFVKPPIPFFIVFALFLGVTLRRERGRSVLLDSHLWVFAIGCLLPAATFYLIRFLAVTPVMPHTAGRFIPHLLLRPGFYAAWLKRTLDAVGSGGLLGAMLGILWLRRGLPRATAVSLWFGYVCYGLVFNYHVHTHDYYSLLLLPIVALCLGPVGEMLLVRLREATDSRLIRAAVAAMLLGALSLAVGPGIIIDRRDAAEQAPKERATIRVAKKVGELVKHSTRTVLLTADYGNALKYYGWLAGRWWPNDGDLRKEQLMGNPQLDAKTRFKTQYRSLAPDFFIITDLDTFAKGRDLRDFLTHNYTLLHGTEDYIIFDLTAPNTLK